MKVFWSWQSDTPGKTGRFLVRDVIKEAIDDLVEEIAMEESQREVEDAEIHFDQDRQGVSGIPDLAKTIFTKIEAASVVIADVTPTGSVAIAQEEGPAKKLINSNVAIELGFALAKVGDAYIIMVANAYYGKHSDLPFDLRGKAGPIFYQLEPSAPKDEIEKEKKNLKASVKTAMKECLRARLKERQNQAVTEQAQKHITAANWERMAELIERDGSGVAADSAYQSDTKETTWALKGAESGVCGAHLARAGAMLLRSPKLREALPPVILNEANDLKRWLALLQIRGCVSGGTQGYSELPDGSRIVYVWGSIYNLAAHSKRACLEFANTEY